MAFKEKFVHSWVTVVDGHASTESVDVVSTHRHFVGVDELVYLFVSQLKLPSVSVWAWWTGSTSSCVGILRSKRVTSECSTHHGLTNCTSRKLGLVLTPTGFAVRATACMWSCHLAGSSCASWVLLICHDLLCMLIVSRWASLVWILTMNVIVMTSVSIEVRADEKGTNWHALVELLLVLRGFIRVSAGAVAWLTFIHEVILSLVWVWNRTVFNLNCVCLLSLWRTFLAKIYQTIWIWSSAWSALQTMSRFWRLLLDVLRVFLLVHVHHVWYSLSVLVFVTGSLAVSPFFFDDELLSWVCVDLGSSYQLVGLSNLLLLVLFQTLLTLIRRQLTVGCTLW